MCGRFTQLFSYAELHEYWRTFSDPLAPVSSNMQPRYHLCPTDPVWAITHDKGANALEHMRWQLVPFFWKKTLKDLPATFNARAETVETKPTFREAFKRRRAIIPASGWYEWQVTKSGKQPWYFTPAHGSIALIAGLWESWKNPETGDVVRSCTMVITEPNEFVAQYHDRMPVVLAPGDVTAWLTAEKGHELLKPAPEDELKAWPVNRRVNSSKAPDEPGLIVPIDLTQDGAPRGSLL